MASPNYVFDNDSGSYIFVFFEVGFSYIAFFIDGICPNSVDFTFDILFIEIFLQSLSQRNSASTNPQ